MPLDVDRAEGPELIRASEASKIAGLSKSSIWRLLAAGRFPRPVKLGPQTTRFDRREVEAWVEARLAERGAPRAQP